MKVVFRANNMEINIEISKSTKKINRIKLPTIGDMSPELIVMVLNFCLFIETELKNQQLVDQEFAQRCKNMIDLIKNRFHIQITQL